MTAQSPLRVTIHPIGLHPDLAGLTVLGIPICPPALITDLPATLDRLTVEFDQPLTIDLTTPDPHHHVHRRPRGG